MNTINYNIFKRLFKVNPKEARKIIVETYYNEGEKNISKTARLLGICRKTVRKAIRRYLEGGEDNLSNRSTRPKHSPNKTPPYIERAIIEAYRRCHCGRDRLYRLLKEKPELKGRITISMVRYTLRRHKLAGRYTLSAFRKKRRYYDFEELYPLSYFQVDVKEIFDRTALSERVIRHAEDVGVPPYQFTAIDIKTRMRFIAYGFEKTFTNGLNFMLSVLHYVRGFGVRWTIVFQTDNGEEFGGKSRSKLAWLNREIFIPLNSFLIHIPPGRKEENGFVERSHRTDDEEFYIPQLGRVKDLEEFYERAWRWEMYYNLRRYHSTIGRTPYEKLRSYYPLPEVVTIFPIKRLDEISVNHYFYNSGKVPEHYSKGGDEVLTNYTTIKMIIGGVQKKFYQ